MVDEQRGLPELAAADGLRWHPVVLAFHHPAGVGNKPFHAWKGDSSAGDDEED